MNAAEVVSLGQALGLDAVGITRAEAYVETERHIRDRRRRGLFAGMKFTMAQPERSCHPETLLEGARTVISAALCYWTPETPIQAGHGRLARYTWNDAYAELRETLDALGRRLGGAYRVLVDANQHVDREAAARSGVGFYGKNTMLITRRHGSWVVLGTLVSDRELAGDRATRRRIAASAGSASMPARPRRSTSRERSMRPSASRTGCRRRPRSRRSTARRSAPRSTAATSARTSVPGTVASASGVTAKASDAGHVDLVAWLEQDGQQLIDAYERLYVPRNDPRWLRRNALVALGNVGGPEHEPVLSAIAAGDDELEREHAEWALERIGARA